MDMENWTEVITLLNLALSWILFLTFDWIEFYSFIFNILIFYVPSFHISMNFRE